MGTWSPISRSSYDSNDYTPPTGNPNPYNFKIIRVYDTTHNTAVMIEYPDAKNYEGKKILVYKGTNSHKLREQKSLDPHFSEKGLAPFARFEPTDEGWQQAMYLAEIL